MDNLKQDRSLQNRRSFVKKMILLGGIVPALGEGMVFSNSTPVDKFKIVISHKAEKYEKDAAILLQDYIYRASSLKFEIIDDLNLRSSNEIVIGKTNRSPSNILGKDGFSINSYESSCNIQGDKKGLFFGVVQFIKELFNYNIEFISGSYSKQAIPGLSDRPVNVLEKPCFNYRFMYYSQGFNKDYQFFNRLSTFDVDAETGKLSFEDCGSVVHNFLLLFGYDKYFDKNPEYYPFINGERTKLGLQEGSAYRVPCLTNEGVYQIILSELKKRIKIAPHTKIWNLSLPDGISGSDDYCSCSACIKKYNLGNGLSETFFPFLNRLAHDLPNYILRTLAYTVTSRPHTVSTKLSNGEILNKSELAKNIEIIFTLPDNDKSKPISVAVDEKSLLYKNNLVQWKAITNNIFIWEYIVNFNYYLFPFPTLHTIKDNFNFFRENNVKSILIQSSSMEVSALAELNSYVYSQLMWDNSKDMFDLIGKFCSEFYGTASEEMFKYVNSLLNNIKRNRSPIWNPMSGIGSLVFHANPDNSLEDIVLFSIKHLKEYKKLLNIAKKKSENTVYNKRVLKEYLCILFVEIEASTQYANKAGGKFSIEFYNFVTNNNKVSFNSKFIEFLSLCAELRIDYISENLRTPYSYISDVKTSMQLN